MGAELSGFLASDGNHRWIGVGTGPVSGPRHRQRRVKARGIYKDKDRGVWIFRSLSFPHTLPRPPRAPLSIPGPFALRVADSEVRVLDPPAGP